MKKTDKYPKDLDGYYVEVSDTIQQGFRFRIRNGRRKSPWGGYRSIVRLDDRFAVAEFYEGGYRTIDAEKVFQLIGVVQ